MRRLRPLIALAAAAAGIATLAALSPRPADLPFAVQTVARFQSPWALAFLPDGRLLVTEHAGALHLVAPDGRRSPVPGLPPVLQSGQLGLHDIAPAPDFARSRQVYLTHVAPTPGGGQLVLSRATLTEEPALTGLTELWRQPQEGGGGHPGGIIAFDPDGAHLFLTLGERTLDASAQNPDHARGKLLRLTLDGAIPADNPQAAAGGVRGATWSTGHRNPYGLAFAPDGQLWLHEMGPRDGDELNRIAPGANYGWPEVSEGVDYSGEDIPDHATRPEFTAPALAWLPGIAPSGLAFYQGDLFEGWQGSALIGALAGQSLIRVTFADGTPVEADRWRFETRLRDVAVAPDGAVWLLEDGDPGRLMRVVPG